MPEHSPLILLTSKPDHPVRKNITLLGIGCVHSGQHSLCEVPSPAEPASSSPSSGNPCLNSLSRLEHSGIQVHWRSWSISLVQEVHLFPVACHIPPKPPLRTGLGRTTKPVFEALSRTRVKGPAGPGGLASRTFRSVVLVALATGTEREREREIFRVPLTCSWWWDLHYTVMGHIGILRRGWLCCKLCAGTLATNHAIPIASTC